MNAAPASSNAETLARLARRYGWDMGAQEARDRPAKLILRVMDIGVWEDMLALEAVLGKDFLKDTMAAATAGSLRPKSWNFWAIRLGLYRDGAPPPMPVRRLG